MHCTDTQLCPGCHAAAWGSGRMLGGGVFPKALGCCQKWPGTSLPYLCSLSVVCCSAEQRKSCRHHQKPSPVDDRHTDLPRRTQPGLSLPPVTLLDTSTARHQVSTEIRPPWVKVATWLGPALEAGPMLLLAMNCSHWSHCSSLPLWDQR